MEFRVESCGCSLYCEKRGCGPVILMIHGVGSDADYFAAAAAVLAETYTVITYDRRGHSRSGCRTEAGYTLAQEAEDACRVLETVTDDPALIAGSSAGGLVALKLAEHHPDRVGGLMLYETPLTADEEHQLEMRKLMEQLKPAGKPLRMTRAYLHLLEAMGGFDKAAPEKTLEQQAQALENFRLFLEYEMEDFLGYSVKKETVGDIPFVMGLGSGSANAGGFFEKMAEAGGSELGAELVWLPGYHNFPEDHPDLFAEWIRDYKKKYSM